MGARCVRAEEPIVQATPIPFACETVAQVPDAVQEQHNLAVSIAYVASLPTYLVEVTRDKNIIVRTDLTTVTFRPDPIFAIMDIRTIKNDEHEQRFQFDIKLGRNECNVYKRLVIVKSHDREELVRVRELVTFALMGFVIFVPPEESRTLQGDVIRMGELQIVTS